MDLETAIYINDYYNHLLTDKEKLANRHISSMIKLEYSNTIPNLEKLTKLYKKMGWLTECEDALILTRLGEEGFKIKVAERILSEHKDKIFMNYCPQCARLARTPFAKQCRCGYDWHKRSSQMS